jgi:hypothetical protein
MHVQLKTKWRKLLVDNASWKFVERQWTELRRLMGATSNLRLSLEYIMRTWLIDNNAANECVQPIVDLYFELLCGLGTIALGEYQLLPPSQDAATAHYALIEVVETFRQLLQKFDGGAKGLHATHQT